MLHDRVAQTTLCEAGSVEGNLRKFLNEREIPSGRAEMCRQSIVVSNAALRDCSADFTTFG